MQPGDTISHYEVLERLGGGGMGVVYKARDTLLNRPVALKFLPSHLSTDRSAKERFIQEAQAASALDHAGICTIYEIGETEEGELFIAMAFYEGQTLKYRLENETFSRERAIDIVGQLVRGLQHAHEAGIVHRDIKPANVMVTDRGEVKLLDFGLAKLSGGANLTAVGNTLGTAAYMSPEQARGDTVGPATDVWSLGTLCYEMLAGRRPFQGDYDQAVIYAIINEEPIPIREINPDVEPELGDLVMRCLDKEPAHRPTLAELRLHLVGGSGSHMAMTAAGRTTGPSLNRKLVAGGVLFLLLVAIVGAWIVGRSTTEGTSVPVEDVAGARPSVAVLPFTARSANADDQYFVGGVHDDILTQLAKIKALKVISRTSVMQYARTVKPIREIGKELGVSTVLEGSVDRSGDRIRLNVQLIDTQTDEHLWADTYDEQLTAANVFAIRTDLARKVAAALKATLSAEEETHIESKPTESLEAYDLYSRGQYLLNATGLSSETIDRAAGFFEKAIAADAGFGPAYAGLAQLHFEKWAFLGGPPGPNLTEAERLASRALELDDDLAEAHLAKGLVLMAQLEYEKASTEFSRAIDISPSFAEAHRRYAFLLRRVGKHDEALQELYRAVEMDPLNIRTRTSYASLLENLGDHDAALRETAKILELEPNSSTGYYQMGATYTSLGRYDEAIAAYTRAGELDPGDPYNAAGLAYAYARAGQKDKALKIMATIEDSGAMMKEKSIVYGVLGDLDTAFRLMETASKVDPAIVVEMETDRTVPVELRRDPRFRSIIDRIKG